jgi:VanZ family protein
MEAVTRTRTRAAWWIGFALAVALALLLSFAAYTERLPSALAAGQSDKVIHLLVAGLLAFFLDGALARRNVVVVGAPVSLAATLVLAPAALEEFLQRFSTTRESNVWDFAADVVGVAFFTWCSRRLAITSRSDAPS